MKKFILFMLSLTLTFGSFIGCGDSEGGDNTSSPATSIEESSNGSASSEEKINYYTITFKQAGQDDVVKQVEAGKDLADIPAPVQKTGYTTKWSVENFTAIAENMTVEAVATANEYTITYNAGEGEVSPETQKVTYDAVPESFVTPTRYGYDFICWTYEGKAVQATDVWKIAGDVTLVASWIEKEKRTVTFVQTGYEPIIVEVYDGETLTGDQIPDTQPKEGYRVFWEEKIPSSIKENVVVNAYAIANTYTITYDAGEGTVAEPTQQVTYDSAPESFAVPTREGYKFKGWEYQNNVLSATDLWTIASDVTLTAKWAKICTVKLNANGGTLSETTITVVQGEAYTLPTPTRVDFGFTGWKYGTSKVATSGVWTIDSEEITLTAGWREVGWTDNY